MRKNLWIVLVVVGASLPIAYVLKDFFRNLIVVPVGNALAMIQIYFETIPQFFVWMVLLVVMLVLMGRTLISVKELFKPHSRTPMRRKMGPVESWQDWIVRARGGRYFEGKLAHRISSLGLSILAFRYEISQEEVLKRIESEEITLPEQVSGYIRKGLDKESWGSFNQTALESLMFLKGREHMNRVIGEVHEVVDALDEKLRG